MFNFKTIQKLINLGPLILLYYLSISEIDTHFENFFDFNVIDVSANSRIIKNNFIYAAVKGTNDNGENYLSDVIKFRKIAVLISKSTKINLSNKHK